jgi:putative endonuclease
MNTSAKGRLGEETAQHFLEGQGYRILANNYRSIYGEIDIIGIKNKSLVFLEVKNWNTVPPEFLEQAIGPRKRTRIIKSALCYLREHPEMDGLSRRFDVVFVSDRGGSILHIKDAIRGDG